MLFILRFFTDLLNFSRHFTIIYVLMGVFLFIGGCSNTKTIVSPQVNQPIEIDGDLSEWPHSQALLKEGNYFNYYATHDSANLYLYVNLKNVQFKQLIEDNGLTIYVSPNKKNKKKLGITYPVGAFNFLKDMPGTYQQFKQDPKWIKKPENQKLLEELRQDNYKKAMVSQRQNKKETPQEVIIDVSRLEAQGIQIAREQLHNRLQLELSIPLKSTKTQQFAVVPGKSNTVQVGFTISPPERQINQESTTVDLSQRSVYRGPYGRYRDDQQMEQRLEQLTGSHDAWFSIQLSKD